MINKKKLKKLKKDKTKDETLEEIECKNIKKHNNKVIKLFPAIDVNNPKQKSGTYSYPGRQFSSFEHMCEAFSSRHPIE